MAGVTEDGDFSVFQGIDRSLAILSGDGIVLDVAGQPHHLTMDAAPLAFPADAPASARLISGPVTDLNLIPGAAPMRIACIVPRMPRR